MEVETQRRKRSRATEKRRDGGGATVNDRQLRAPRPPPPPSPNVAELFVLPGRMLGDIYYPRHRLTPPPALLEVSPAP